MATTSLHDAVTAWAGRLGAGRYGVACSGGADSIALADVVVDVVGPARVVVVTIDHALQPASADIADRVARWARGRGAEAVVRRVEVARAPSLEAAARAARYAALGSIVAEHGLACVLLGHTARDQAETVLMRIARGTGPAGLAGMPARRGPFVRPLLELPRAAIDAYVAARQLPVWDDPMNADARFARARFRKDVIPALRRENPALDDALVRLAASTREWLAAIDARAQALAALPIDCRALAGEPPAIRKRAVALALDAAGLGHDAAHLEQVDALVTGPRRGEVGVDVPGGRVVRSYDALAIAASAPVVAALATPAGPYLLRTWRRGDRMRPARLRGRSRKLSDLYSDAKLPRARRRDARVLVRTSDDTIVWAEHLGLAFGESEDLVPLPARSSGSF